MIKATRFFSVVLILALVLSMLATFMTASPVRAATINVPGDYATIQLAVNAANPAGGDTIIVSGGPYVENVNIDRPVTLQAPGGVWVQAAVTTDHVFEVTANNVNISGFKLSGATTANYAGIYLAGVSGCNIQNNMATGNYQGIAGGGSNNILQYNIANDNSDRGIVLWGAVNNTLRNNNADSNDFLGICLYSGSTNNKLIGNLANENLSGGVVLASSSVNTLQGNTANGNGGHGFYLESSSNNNILTGNTANNNSNGIAIDLSSNNNTLSGNTATYNGNGIHIHLSTGNTVSNNKTKNNNNSGILLDDADNNNINGNETGNNPAIEQGYGITLTAGSMNNTVTGNIITGNELMGILALACSDSNTFSNNQIYNNLAEGIYVEDSLNCTIDGNVIHDNVSHTGIDLHHCTNFQVKNNEVYNEEMGIRLGASDNCTILNNSIHDNSFGIYVTCGSVDTSDDNKILGNNIFHNRPETPGTHAGIYLSQYAWRTIIHFNIIIDNCSDPEWWGLYNGNTCETVNAENNWWGANNGPEPTGNGDKVSENVDFTPWLVLTIGANPTSVETGGNTSAINGKLTMNSAGQDTSGQGHIPNGTPIIFNTDKGAIGSLQVTKATTNGQANAILTPSNIAETATVCASAPHGHEVPVAQYRVCTNVDFIAPILPGTQPSESSWSQGPEYNLPRESNVVTLSVRAQPQQAVANQEITIFGNIANRGDIAGDYKAILKIDGKVEEIKNGQIAGNKATPLEFTVYRDEPGTYQVELNGQTTFFTIAGSTKSSPIDGRMIIVIVLSVLVLATVVVLIRHFATR